MNEQLAKAIDGVAVGLDAFKTTYGRNLSELQERVERIEAFRDAPTRAANDSTFDHKIRGALESYYRKGDKVALGKFGNTDVETKANEFAIGSTASGSYMHVPELATSVLAAVGEVAPLYADVSKISTARNEFRQIYTIVSPTASRSAELGSRSQTLPPVQARVDIPLYDLFAYVYVSNEELDSSNFDVVNYINGEVVRQFAATIENEIANGSGSTAALGIVTQTTSATIDNASPLRSFALFQYKSDTSSPITLPGYDDIVDLVAQLAIRYRPKAKFYASTPMVQRLRKIKDTTNMPLWKDATGGIAGAPQSILGYPVVECPVLPSIASTNKPLYFGDLGQAYLWVTHNRGMRIIRDEVTTPGVTKFYFSLQCSGKPGDTRALKALRIG